MHIRKWLFISFLLALQIWHALLQNIDPIEVEPIDPHKIQIDLPNNSNMASSNGETKQGASSKEKENSIIEIHNQANANANPNPDAISTADPTKRSDSNEQAEDAAKKAYIEAKQQEKEIYEKRQEEGKKFNVEELMQKSQTIRSMEKWEVRSAINQAGQQVSTSQVIMFEMDSQVEQFYFHPASPMKLYFKIIIYVEKDNMFGLANGVNENDILKMYVYEDNTRIVAQSQFFYQKMLVIDTKANSQYTVRFYNSGIKKLVILEYPNILSEKDLQILYQKSKNEEHFLTTRTLLERVKNSLGLLRTTKAIDGRNKSVFAKHWANFSSYQMVQVLGIIGISILQIKLIKGMFKSQSIL